MTEEMPTIEEVLDVAQRYVDAMEDNDHDAARKAWDAMDNDTWLPLRVYLSAMSFAMAYEEEQVGGDEV